MLTFCPTCGNVLLLDADASGSHASSSSSCAVRLTCNACDYAYDVTRGVKQKVAHRRKRVDDVLGGDDAWKNVDRTRVDCPKCDGTEAYFMQIQIRSADEPMSVFYKCCSCARQWREG